MPRNQEGIALVGDPRNDVHLFMSQMQVGFIRLHNRLVDRLREDGTAEAELFEEARRAATWHYQWVILREFLPLLIGAELTAELLDGGARLYRPESDPYIPFEFADAAYRYGHSQIRQRYQVNDRLRPGAGVPGPDGLRRGARGAAGRLVAALRRPGRPPAQRAKRIDGRLPEYLIALPQQISGADAWRRLRLAGQPRPPARPGGRAAVGRGGRARRSGSSRCRSEQVGLAEHGWTEETPLWFYILKEAEALHDGDRLGPVGGRIVGEVLVGIIDADPESFRSVDRSWTPTLPSHEPGHLRDRRHPRSRRSSPGAT